MAADEIISIIREIREKETLSVNYKESINVNIKQSKKRISLSTNNSPFIPVDINEPVSQNPSPVRKVPGSGRSGPTVGSSTPFHESYCGTAVEVLQLIINVHTHTRSCPGSNLNFARKNVKTKGLALQFVL